jgi:WD40 repeat protein
VAVGLAVAVLAGGAGADDGFVGPPRPENVLRVVRVIDTGEKPIFGIAYCPDGRAIAVADGFKIRFYDPTTGKETRKAWVVPPKAVPAQVLRVRFLDAATLVHDGGDAVARVRAYPSGEEVAGLDLGRSIFGWDAAPGVVAIVTGGTPYHLRVWAAPGWKAAWSVEVPVRPGDIPHAVLLSPDRTEVAVGTGSGYVHVFRAADGKLLRSLDRVAARATNPRMAYRAGGRELAVADGWGRNVDPPEPEYAAGVWDAGLTAARVRPGWGRGGEQGSRHALGCVFTPDGKTLLVPCRGGTVRAYEAATGKLRHVGHLPDEPYETALSPCGRLLAVRLTDPDSGQGRGVALVDWRANNADRRVLADVAWADLTSADAGIGYRAVVALGADPAGAAKLIGEKLRPAAAADPAAVRKLVSDLGAADFADREAATAGLAKLGEAAAAGLRAAAKDDDPERRERAGKLLRTIDRADAPDRLRAERAVEVLEYADTPAGRAVLKGLAGGAPAARLTADATAALARLAALAPKP